MSDSNNKVKPKSFEEKIEEKKNWESKQSYMKTFRRQAYKSVRKEK